MEGTKEETEQQVGIPEVHQVKIISVVAPWPAIIILVIGAAAVMYTAVAPKIDPERRFFGVLFLTLWVLMWGLLLWLSWKDSHYTMPWWLLIVPTTVVLLFVILVTIMDIGST